MIKPLFEVFSFWLSGSDASRASLNPESMVAPTRPPLTELMINSLLFISYLLGPYF
jgi:hypothetical protein